MDHDDPVETVFRMCEMLAGHRSRCGDDKFLELAEQFADDVTPLVAKARQSLRMERIGHELTLHDAILGEDA